MIYQIIVIVASLILGAFAGRIANMLYNRDSLTINPMICTIVGLLGGGLGSWVFGTLSLTGGRLVYVFQLAAGVGLAVLLLLMLLPFRDRSNQEE